jgi:hypothetical protein
MREMIANHRKKQEKPVLVCIKYHRSIIISMFRNTPTGKDDFAKPVWTVLRNNSRIRGTGDEVFHSPLPPEAADEKVCPLLYWFVAGSGRIPRAGPVNQS